MKLSISPRRCMELVIKYYHSIQDKIQKHSPDIIFVGDIHGDFHQFISPLIYTGMITLTGKWKEVNINDKFPEVSFIVPEYKFNKVGVRIYYMGDLCDNWINSREILFMMHDILKKTDNVRFILGNHDCRIIGNYDNWKNHTLDLYESHINTWIATKMELEYSPNVFLSEQLTTYKSDEKLGMEFIYEYLKPIFGIYHDIFTEKLCQVGDCIQVGSKVYIISHTSWTQKALRDLLGNPNFSSPVELVRLVNDKFLSSKQDYISRNYLTYTRNQEGVMFNHIVGHSIGDEWMEIGVNKGDSRFTEQRKSKLTPETTTRGHEIYYFDFGSSAGCNIEDISRPDYVFRMDGVWCVSDLPAFELKFKDKKYSMIVYERKTTKLSSRYSLDLSLSTSFVS